MGSEGAESGRSLQTAQQPVGRPASRRRRKKLILVGIVVVVAVVILFWGWSSTGREYMSVGALVDQSAEGVPTKYAGKLVEVKGVVAGWDGTAEDLSFALVDEKDPNKSVEVTVNGTLPAGFENGKTVVVKGVLSPDLPLRIAASEITVGCASKY